jgi:chromosome segregation ATPase
MANKELVKLQKQIEDLQINVKEIHVQISLMKDKAVSLRRERYELMKNFAENKKEVFEKDAQEKECWDNVRSLTQMKEELEEQLGAQKVEIVQEAVKLRNETYKELKVEGDKVTQELTRKRFEYLVELEKKVKEANSKSREALTEIDLFILEHGNQHQKKHANGDKRDVVDTMYGRLNNTPSHFVGNKDYTLLFHDEEKQHFTYRLFKLTGEIVLDENEAQRKLSEALKKKGSKK